LGCLHVLSRLLCPAAAGEYDEPSEGRRKKYQPPYDYHYDGETDTVVVTGFEVWASFGPILAQLVAPVHAHARPCWDNMEAPL
jgi:hypothetical protein